jgi:soluble lytic murein transglycosylase-like protein
MSVGQVIIIVKLLAGVYGVDPALMDCIVAHESDYSVDAVNGANIGLVQWRPETRAWLAEKASGDPSWLHGNIGAGPVQDVALAAWALKNNFGSHWATYSGCGGVQ